MLNRSLITFGARFLVLSLIFGVCGIFNTGSTLAANNSGVEPQTAGSQDSTSQLNGQLIANGSVTVNGNKAITGTTIFTDSRITVDPAKGNSAIVNLGKLGRIELVAGTKLLLQFTDGQISGNLEEGQAVVNVPDGVKVAINTPNNGVSPSGGQEPVKVITVHDTILVPPTAAPPATAPAPVPIPVGGGGLSGWAIGGIVAGAGGVTAAAVVAADDDDNDLFVPAVSPVTP